MAAIMIAARQLRYFFIRFRPCFCVRNSELNRRILGYFPSQTSPFNDRENEGAEPQAEVAMGTSLELAAGRRVVGCSGRPLTAQLPALATWSCPLTAIFCGVGV